VIFIIFIIVFLTESSVYGKKIDVNNLKIKQNEESLQSLQNLILNTNKNNDIDLNVFQNKSFADYDEVIPFIALLESMFAPVDPQAEISVKSQQDQIFLNHYADYKINLKFTQKDLLYKALEELYSSRFITKITDFSMNYSQSEDGKINNFTSFEFTIRLFLK